MLRVPVNVSELMSVLIVKYVQHIGIIRAFCLPGGSSKAFQYLRRPKQLLGCGLLGVTSNKTDTMFFITVKVILICTKIKKK